MKEAIIKFLAKIIAKNKIRKMAKAKKDEKKQFMQFTKKYVIIVSLFAFIWVTWSYILGTYAMTKFGNSELLLTLSAEVIRSIIFVTIGYMSKSFVETYCEKKMELDAIQPPTSNPSTTETQPNQFYNGI